MSEQIDLNRADAATLASLPGIGSVLAERIVEYRETVRPFTELIELTAVSGISERMVREIEGLLTVGAVQELEVADEAVEPAGTEEAETEVLEPESASAAEPAPEITEPEPVPDAAAERPSPAPPRSGFREHLFTAVMGALLGAALTLAVLWLLNGTLQLNQTAQVERLERQSAEAAAALQAEQAGAQAELHTLTEQLVLMNTRESETAVQLETMQTNLADTQDQLDTLAATSAELDERISIVAASAENFDAFLNGMRDLLWTLQGPPPAATPTPTATPTAAVTMTATITATTAVTVTPTTTVTPFATRTPRPTATPLGETPPTALPTATPTE